MIIIYIILYRNLCHLITYQKYQNQCCDETKTLNNNIEPNCLCIDNIINSYQLIGHRYIKSMSNMYI